MKTKVLISCAVTAQLNCVFFFAYAIIRFSHDAAYMNKAGFLMMQIKYFRGAKCSNIKIHSSLRWFTVNRDCIVNMCCCSIKCFSGKENLWVGKYEVKKKLGYCASSFLKFGLLFEVQLMVCFLKCS